MYCGGPCVEYIFLMRFIFVCFFIKMAVRWSPVWESEFAVFKQDLRIYRCGEKVSSSVASTPNRVM